MVTSVPRRAHAAAIVALALLSGHALADGRVSVPKASVYRDGVWNNGAGQVYIYYYNQPNQNPFGELRNTTYNLAQAKAAYNNGTIGFLNFDNQGNPLTFNGANANAMQDHTTNYGWNSNFSVQCNVNNNVEVDVHLNFDWTGSGLNAAQQTTTRNAWEQDIENWWSNRYAVNDANGNHPIVFDVRFDAYANGAPYDQTVTVLAGNGRADLTHWYAQSTGAVEAHEFGHMIGAFDEYWGGALNAGLLTDYNGIMGTVTGLASGGGLRARYFQDILDVYNGKGGPGGAGTIVAIPTPGGLLLLSLSGLLAGRRRRA